MGGFNSHAIAEYVLGMIIVFSKGIRGYVINQQSHLWQRSRSVMVAGRTVGVIGLGRIGAEVAKLCKGLDMRVLANRRSPGEPPPYVDQLYGPDGLHEMLGECDYVVLALPSIPETIDIIGAAEFRAMKETAVFINIARGVQVVEAEMAEALKNGVIARARPSTSWRTSRWSKRARCGTSTTSSSRPTPPPPSATTATRCPRSSPPTSAATSTASPCATSWTGRRATRPAALAEQAVEDVGAVAEAEARLGGEAVEAALGGRGLLEEAEAPGGTIRGSSHWGAPR